MPPKTAPAPHKTPTQILGDVALAQAQRPRSEPVSTVALTLNARGDVQIQVDVDDPDPAVAAQLAGEIFDTLCAKYPRSDA